jgi:hypothetical protein
MPVKKELKVLVKDADLEGNWGAPASRELGALFQEAFNSVTGQNSRWAAENVQGNRRFDRAWCVPFTGESGLRGHFSLNWDAEFQRYLAGRCGANAQRPEFMGAILRSAAGKWAAQQSLRHDVTLRLLPSEEALPEMEQPVSPSSSSAALFVDAFVLELGFSLDQRPARP